MIEDQHKAHASQALGPPTTEPIGRLPLVDQLLRFAERGGVMMQFTEDYDYYEPEEEPDSELDPAERVRIMLTAFRRAPAKTVREWEKTKRRYRAWREERLTPFVSALANIIVADLTRGPK